MLGGCALVGAGVFGEAVDRGAILMGVFAMVGSVIAHKITCWIIRGFLPAD